MNLLNIGNVIFSSKYLKKLYPMNGLFDVSLFFLTENGLK